MLRSERDRAVPRADCDGSQVTVANRTVRFVGADDDAEIGGREFEGAHLHRERSGVEEAASGSEDHGEGHQSEPVDEIVLEQCPEQLATAPDLELVARLLLQ